jgi:hypothetical protein
MACTLHVIFLRSLRESNRVNIFWMTRQSR